MSKPVINPEVVEDVALTSGTQSLISKPAVKYTGLIVTGLIGVYGTYRLGKFVYGKIRARRAEKANKVEEPNAEPAPAEPQENPAA